MLRASGPFEALENINDNTNNIDLSGDCGVSSTFNVADLKLTLKMIILKI